MALAFAFIKLNQLNQAAADAGKPSLAEALTVTGADIDCFERDVVDDQPGEPYIVQRPERWGGYAIIGQEGAWSAMLLASTAQKITAIDNQAALIGNLMILLAMGTKDEEAGSGYDWDALLSQEDVDFINGKIEDANLPIDPIGYDETMRQAVRRLYKYFDPDFEIEQWGLQDLENAG